MSERVPHVYLTVEWLRPLDTKRADIVSVEMNSDRAMFKAREAAIDAVLDALQSEDGHAELIISVDRKAKNPTGVRIVGDVPSAEEGT